MPQPIGPQNVNQGLTPPQLNNLSSTRAADLKPSDSFKDVLLENLEEVNRLQMEAAKGVEMLATGESDNVAEIFSAVRKADVAFSMLMEMRNKLVEAYRELQQMRV